MEFLGHIQHFYMQVDKHKVEFPAKLAYVEDCGLAFSTAYLVWVVLKQKFTILGRQPLPAMLMSNTAKVILERFKDHQLTS